MEKVLMAFGLSGILALVLGPVIIPMLQKLKFGQYIRDDGPQRHLKKAGTPTMGGVIFLAALTLSFLIFTEGNAKSWVLLLVTLGYGAIGFLDDYIKVVKGRNLGLRAIEKIIGQTILAAILMVVSVYVLDLGTNIIVPFSGYSLDLGILGYFLFVLVVMVGTTNAVNLTDGLDGLAAGVTFVSALAFLLIGVMVDQMEVALFAATLAGSCLGFLRYNKHPARVFMGDTGSLALGGALAAMAVLTKTELLLPIIGGVYVVETLSVIIQVISFKTTGKRVFRMSPLHHHFELSGWQETKVVSRFWGAAVLCAIVGLMGMHNIG